ncbi:MAG: hypothetical protein LIO95_11000 [Clostridiales bacterium]|nr:hypothetical protein [Clostridiales bacterium]
MEEQVKTLTGEASLSGQGHTRKPQLPARMGLVFHFAFRPCAKKRSVAVFGSATLPFLRKREKKEKKGEKMKKRCCAVCVALFAPRAYTITKTGSELLDKLQRK